MYKTYVLAFTTDQLNNDKFCKVHSLFSRSYWGVKDGWGSLYKESPWASVRNFLFILRMKKFMKFCNILYLHRQIPYLFFSRSVNIYLQETLWETSKKQCSTMLVTKMQSSWECENRKYYLDSSVSEKQSVQ